MNKETTPERMMKAFHSLQIGMMRYMARRDKRNKLRKILFKSNSWHDAQ